MGVFDIVNLVIALYGAVIASILGYQEIQKRQKRLKIIFEFVAFQHRAQLILINTGEKPINLSEINMSLYINEHWDQAPRNSIFDQNEPQFPIKINESDQITIGLSHHFDSDILQNKENIKIEVFDIEGKKFSKFSARLFNDKWGTYDEL